jgi:hypothetical protein
MDPVVVICYLSNRVFRAHQIGKRRYEKKGKLILKDGQALQLDAEAPSDAD